MVILFLINTIPKANPTGKSITYQLGLQYF
nr:MAG TPA: hypothetical protein [Caudoviricetes sp.]